MSKIFKDINLKDCNKIFSLDKSSKHIEIYGEIHSKPITRINSYSKMIPTILKETPLILLEHNTLSCDLKIMSEEIKKFMLSYGGSETIFFNLNKNKYKKFKCIDNRLELNLLSGFHEKEFYKFTENLLISTDFQISKDFFQIIMAIKKQVDNISSFESYFEKTYYQNIFNDYLFILMRQMEIVLLFLKKGLQKDTFFTQKIFTQNNWHIFIVTILDILNNLRQFGSIIVDINILNQIKKSRSHNIIIYVGNNHADRLSKILQHNHFKLNKIEGDFTPELNSFNPISNDISEKILLEKLSI